FIKTIVFVYYTMCDRNHKQIIALLDQPGNQFCADCGSKDLQYGSYNLGVFLCTTCATFHQKIGTHVSKVKWNDDQVEGMKSLGNSEAKKKYEKHCPIFYRKPSPDDPVILLEQWIRAKYERLEFIHVDKQKYNTGSMEDNLLVKKRRDDSNYAPKRFVLSQENGVLSIYSNEVGLKRTENINSTSKIEHLPCTSKNEPGRTLCNFTFIEEGVTRHVFVTHENGEVLIDWYMAIRYAKLLTLRRAYPTASEAELLPYLTKDFEMEGWVSKTGPHENDAYRKRWVTIDGRKLMYHLNPLDEMPRGEIFIGHSSEGYNIREGASNLTKEMGLVFSLVTPERTFVFSVATSSERNKWMSVIGRVIATPLGTQDFQCRALLDPSKSRASRHSWFHF
ncbi:Arf-GAP with dual PH domain-containing protein 1, partial [Armadillidium nasatum]